MILCHSYKYVFIKSKKVAGSSVKHFLAQHLKEGDIISHKGPHERNPYYNHMTALEFIEVHPDIWESYFTFSIIRHPMERFISEYFYSNRFGSYKSFSEFLRSADARGTLNSDVLRTENCQGFDYVIRYESLLEDLKYLLGRLDIPYNTLDLPRLKGEYRQDKRPWYEFMSVEDKKYIYRNFKQEIEFHRKFGYLV